MGALKRDGRSRYSRPVSAPPAPNATPGRASRRRRIAEDVILVVLAVTVAVLVRSFVAQAYYIPSGSMEPQLHIDDRVIVSRLAYHLHAFHRGDIVVFEAPPGVETPASKPANFVAAAFHDVGVAIGVTQDQSVLIKRVIGLPGDRVWATGGHIYINGDLLVEPYLPKGTITSSFGPITVPKGHLWVMGDNRGDSEDSRYFGPIPERTVIGRAIWKVWPLWRVCFL
jgi:signal peptidase I